MVRLETFLTSILGTTAASSVQRTGIERREGLFLDPIIRAGAKIPSPHQSLRVHPCVVVMDQWLCASRRWWARSDAT